MVTRFTINIKGELYQFGKLSKCVQIFKDPVDNIKNYISLASKMVYKYVCILRSYIYRIFLKYRS